MITSEKLAKYMKFIIKTYPKGCASYNWLNYYADILNDKRFPEDYEFDNIIEECLNEFDSDIGLCGCGIPEETNEVLRTTLNIQSSNCTWKERQKQFSDICNADMDNENYSGLIQFVLYILNDKDILEHGGSVGGSWLSEKGKVYLDLLNLQKEMNENNKD